MRVFWAVFCWSALAWGPCVPEELEFENTSVETAEALARLGRSGRFPESIRTNAAGVERFRELATSHYDPRVVAAGLDALTHHLWVGELEGQDEWLESLLQDRLSAETDLVVDRALDLAEAYLTRGGGEETAKKVASIIDGHPHSGARLRGVQVLARYEGWSTSTDHVATMLEAAQDERPWVAAEAMQRLGWASEEILDPKSVLEEVLKGTEHEQPAVRGRALRAASQLAPEDPWVHSMLRGALSDPDPYVRAEVLRKVGEGGDLRALDQVVGLTGDRASDVLRLTGWAHLDGREGNMRLSVSRTGQVSDTSLDALVALTAMMDDGFTREPLDPNAILDSLVNEGIRASSWYREHPEYHPDGEEAQ